jgi:hypothetical protein
MHTPAGAQAGQAQRSPTQAKRGHPLCRTALRLFNLQSFGHPPREAEKKCLLSSIFNCACLCLEIRVASRTQNIRLAICKKTEEIIGIAYLLDINWINRTARFGNAMFSPVILLV